MLSGKLDVTFDDKGLDVLLDEDKVKGLDGLDWYVLAVKQKVSWRLTEIINLSCSVVVSFVWFLVPVWILASST